MNISDTEILRSQNFIPQCDHWFAVTALDGKMQIPSTAQQVLRRSDVFGDWINQFDVDSLIPTSVVFCKFDYLQHLIHYLEYRRCNTPFILLTGQSDYSITDSAFNHFTSRFSISWWGCNNECYRAKGVPLGIADDFCNLTVKSGFEQTIGKRLLYVNHRVQTFPKIREPLYAMFRDKEWATIRNPCEQGSTKLYKQELLDHKFIVCPRGNGIDTHRMWEALYCGVIPIVQRHLVHSNIEGKLPVLFVDSYHEITEELLYDTYNNFKSKTWKTDMLTVSWWIGKMKGII